MYYTPHLYGIFAALDDPEVDEVVCMKSAQIAWTTALIIWLCKEIATNPGPMIAMFSAAAAAKEFSDEKLGPMVDVSPILQSLIDTSGSTRSKSRSTFKKFPGGFLKLIGSNAVRSVKSTSARIVVVEEPDDAAENLNDQGDSVVLLYERTKRQPGAKRVLGGTPSVKDLSRVERHIKASDKKILSVECHDCGASNTLSFDQVQWLDKDSDQQPNEVFGMAMPETARYVCPGCGGCWDDFQRKENIRNTVFKALDSGDKYGGWMATAEFNGIAGFHELGELYSCLPGGGMRDLVEAKLKSDYEAARGNENEKIVFINSRLGRAYEYGGGNLTAEQLREKVEGYPELVCPDGGWLLTAGIDVQHDRVAVVIRAFGRGSESWLLYWGEISADITTADINDGVYDALDQHLFRRFAHACGGSISLSALTIDSSDGATNDAVYDWVRSRSKLYPKILIMAGKGASSLDKEIFTLPSSRSIDHYNPKKQTKADKKGVKVYLVGTQKGKDVLYNHLKLVLEPDAIRLFHYYEGVRDDYFDQMVAEVKAPHRSMRGKLIWQQKPGKPCEAWDCENYALHAARAKRTNTMKEHQWLVLENRIRQADCFSEQVAVESKPVVEKVKRIQHPVQKPKPVSNSGGGNWVSNSGGEDWV